MPMLGKVMKKKFSKFLLDENGLTTVEYAVAGALVAASLAVAFDSLGNAVAVVIDGIVTLITP